MKMMTKLTRIRCQTTMTKNTKPVSLGRIEIAKDDNDIIWMYGYGIPIRNMMMMHDGDDDDDDDDDNDNDVDDDDDDDDDD